MALLLKINDYTDGKKAVEQLCAGNDRETGKSPLTHTTPEYKLHNLIYNYAPRPKVLSQVEGTAFFTCKSDKIGNPTLTIVYLRLVRSRTHLKLNVRRQEYTWQV